MTTAKRIELALARARRGAAFLDKQLGRGWRRKILRKRLDMGDGATFVREDGESCACILAQLTGDYINGANDLGLERYTPRAVALGFETRLHDGVTYKDLTEAWLQVLREGRSA